MSRKQVGQSGQRLQRVLSIEIIISYLLRGGVIVSGTIIAFGWILHLFRGETEVLSQLLSGKSLNLSVPISLAEFMQGLQRVEPTVVIALGLRVLILLPVLRVILTVVAFMIEKDIIFVFLSSLVLTFLSIGIFFGKAL
jgi:uncharacterized membrane protein